MKKRISIILLMIVPALFMAQSYVTQIGQTMYDLQTNATIGTRVIADEYGISAVWTQGFSPTSFADRGTGYNHWDPETASWSSIPTTRVESYRSGWPSLVHTADGIEWLFAHNGTGIKMVGRDIANNGNWVEVGNVPSFINEPILWSRAASGGINGNTIHLLASTTLNNTFINGLDQQILYYRSQDGGFTWDISDMTFEGMSAPIFGFGGDTYAMSASGNTVAVACFGSLQDSYVWISNDNGNTWTRHIFHDFPIDNYVIDSGTDTNGDGIEDRITSTSTSGSVAVDNNGVVHVSYATMDYIDSPNVYDGQYNFFPASGEIRYWNSASSGNPLDVTDDLNVSAGIAPNIIGDVNINWSQMGLYGFGGLVNHPNVVINDNGDILLLYDAIKEGTMENGLFRRHLFMVKSTDGGFTWSAPTDVSPNIDGVNWEYNYACAAPRVYDGKVHMTAQRDLVPGFSTNLPNAADYNMNSIVYVAIDASTLSNIINGCTDPLACNFSAEATVDDGSCILTPTEEVCDGIDNDCNGEIDNGVLPTWYQDSDEDGFGSAANGIWIGCESISGYVLDNTDCDDFAVMYQDLDGDGLGGGTTTGCGVYYANDCNDTDPNVTTSIYTADFDADGFGDFYNYYLGCSAQPGFILYQDGVTQLDCFDNDPNAVGGDYYGQDQDGDGYANWNAAYWGCYAEQGFVYIDINTSEPDCDDFSLTFSDSDFDGFGSDVLDNCGVYNSDDCDDAVVLFEDIDQDGYGAEVIVACGGSIYNSDCNDYDPNSAVNSLTYYADYDGDGFGVYWDFVTTCYPPSGYVTNALDCYPFSITYADLDGDGAGTTEYAPCGTNNDDDCNDQDPNVTVNFYLQDLDGDGFGNIDVYSIGCTEPIGYVFYGLGALSDCDDNNMAINPMVMEACNNIDDNCDGEVDEFVQSTFFADVDVDGFGNPEEVSFACDQPSGFVTNASDCDDQALTYLDADADGFGSNQIDACGVLLNTDCDDQNISINPSAAEICNEADDNCSGQVDEGVLTIAYLDADQDGFGDAAAETLSCEIPAGYVSNASDCNDVDDNVSPIAAEVCNLTDDNCNGETDEFVQNTYYSDADGDGFGNPEQVIFDCISPIGYVSNSEDCDDAAFAYEDIDADGFGSELVIACGGALQAGDCDDNNGLVSPAQSEICNEQDDNCDTEIDEFVQNVYYADADGDGFGDANATGYACQTPMGFVENMDDCDDSQATYIDADLDGYGSDVTDPCGVGLTGDCDDDNNLINPGVDEIEGNQVDENCDGELVGIAELMSETISVYPNPSQGELNMKLNSVSTVQWQLFDMKGALVAKGVEQNKDFISYQLNNLNSGMYRLVLQTAQNQMMSLNWVIQR